MSGPKKKPPDHDTGVPDGRTPASIAVLTSP